MTGICSQYNMDIIVINITLRIHASTEMHIMTEVYLLIISVHGHAHGLLQLHNHTKILAHTRIKSSNVQLVRLYDDE
jgi:hypothetical protein